jgi:hypothetical protein
MYSNSNARSELQSIISNNGYNYMINAPNQIALKSQLSLIDEEPCKRLNTDPNNILYP